MQRDTIYHRLSYLLAMLPATGTEIALALGRTPGTVALWLRALRAEGIVRTGPVRHNAGRVYELAPSHAFDRRTTEPIPAGLTLFAQAWRALARRHTTTSLAGAIGVTRGRAIVIVSALYERGHIRIAGWVLCRHTPTCVYDRLPLPDVPRPEPKPRQQVNAEYWARRGSWLRAQARKAAAA